MTNNSCSPEHAGQHRQDDLDVHPASNINKHPGRGTAIARTVAEL